MTSKVKTMLSKRELRRMLAAAKAPDTDLIQQLELLARIMTSRVRDPESQADMTAFVRELLDQVTKKHANTKDAAARQVCWNIMHAFSEIGARMIDEAPDHGPSSRTQ
jgi:hypothetical protein